ncbi:MAG: type II toxin-antitoxin system prevent-host-death family antitoxin [Sphingomonadales bacterium]
MQISVSLAKAQLTDLVRRAQSGDDIVLTRRGEPAVRLVPVVTDSVRAERRRILEAFRGSMKGAPGFDDTDAAHSADFLYGDDGLPA